MSIITGLFEWLRECPQLKDLFSIGAREDVGNCVILPQGASEQMQFSESLDVLDGYECKMAPFPSVYEDFQINCYKFYDTNDSGAPAQNVNVLSYDDVRSVCDWVSAQDDAKNFPNIGKNVVSVSCTPFVPQIGYVNEQENTIAYFITLRVRYVNTKRERSVWYEHQG